MAKKRRRARRAIDPLAGPRHPPFGATRAQAKRHQAERDLKNRIHELEQQLANTHSVAATYEKRLAASENPPLHAMTRLCETPVARLVAAGIDVSLVTEISTWLERRKQVKP